MRAKFQENLQHNREQDPHLLQINAFQQTTATISSKIHLASRATEGIADSQMTRKERKVFARTAHEFADLLDDNDPRKISANLYAQMPYFVHAMKILPDKRSKDYGKVWVDNATYERELANKIRYNHALRDIISHNRRLQPDMLMKIVSSVADRYRYTGKDKEQLLQNTEGILYGMQHELAFESVLYYLPEGFEVLETDEINDDSHGADYKVRCPNGTVVSIDVKASLELQEEARYRQENRFARRGQKPPRNNLILYSGFDQHTDFPADEPWRPNHDAVMRVLPYVERELLLASGATPSEHKILAHSH